MYKRIPGTIDVAVINNTTYLLLIVDSWVRLLRNDLLVGGLGWPRYIRSYLNILIRDPSTPSKLPRPHQGLGLVGGGRGGGTVGLEEYSYEPPCLPC